MDLRSAITYSMLKELCNEYRDFIGTSKGVDYPRIRIRYVEDRNKFGYAWFGTFFFFTDDLYVWKEGEEYADEHCQDVVDGVFGDGFKGKGYARRVLFAGVDTNRVDRNGENIFTGDILEITETTGLPMQLALSVFPDIPGVESRYCFVLDNQSMNLDDCLQDETKRVSRIGTAFFQLDWCYESLDMNERIRTFSGSRDTNEEHANKVQMAKYTPNFDKEEWKYYALEIIGAEFDWR